MISYFEWINENESKFKKAAKFVGKTAKRAAIGGAIGAAAGTALAHHVRSNAGVGGGLEHAFTSGKIAASHIKSGISSLL